MTTARNQPGDLDVIDLGPALCLRGTRMHFERNAEIFGEEEPAEYIYRVVTGAVRTMKFSSDGRRQILAFHMPGDIFGIEVAHTHSCSAEAVGDCEIVLVRRSLLEKAANEDVRAARQWLDLTGQNLRKSQDHTLILGHKGAGERIAAFLLRFADRSRSQDIELPMPRADIADYLCLTIETVSRTLTQLERQCAIALPTSRHVVMRNRSALMQLEAAA
ncbi:MAG TPA: cyclic nucleotide-binding domain-containing protein [Vitreimonas sp.]|jgi:CRP/FNR family transcriptional regulator, nitrogen fixation regulation protein|nr:cyclic nucleotide-binding domain-containing protein [Vitreimonas sp.]